MPARVSAVEVESDMAGSRDLDGTFWFCVTHHRVEIFADVDSENRIGPFDTSAAAGNALQTIADREKAYEQEDSAWENGS